MAFVKKTWKDRLSEFPKRWKLKLLGTSGDTQSVELELDDGTVITQGDRFTAATMNDLEQRIADAFESSVSGVSSFNGRVGAISPSNTDYPSSLIKHTNSDTTETTVESAINGLDVNKVDSSQLRSGGSSGTDFYFDYQGGKYGWNSSSARGANTFHPFKQPVVDTKTITAKTTTDLGDDHTYRYIDTTGVVNTNSGTYTASSRGAALDMGASNSYRYVNTNGVPNSNSGTYTFVAGDTGGTKDLGATNTYRYVNAGNVYSAGISAAVSAIQIYEYSVTITCPANIRELHSHLVIAQNASLAGNWIIGVGIYDVSMPVQFTWANARAWYNTDYDGASPSNPFITVQFRNGDTSSSGAFYPGAVCSAMVRVVYYRY